MTWIDQHVNRERVIVAIAALIAAAVFVWWLWPNAAAAQEAPRRFAFAGLGVCLGEDPRFQCTPYFKPDRCNPAVGNWVNASDITCPPDAWNDTHDRYQGRKHHRYQEDKS